VDAASSPGLAAGTALGVPSS